MEFETDNGHGLYEKFPGNHAVSGELSIWEKSALAELQELGVDPAKHLVISSLFT